MSQPGREPNGRFLKGNQLSVGNHGGRPNRIAEEQMLSIFRDCVSEQDFRDIVKRARDDAKNGDIKAMRVIFGYMLGLPVNRVEADIDIDGRIDTAALLEQRIRRAYGSGEEGESIAKPTS